MSLYFSFSFFVFLCFSYFLFFGGGVSVFSVSSNSVETKRAIGRMENSMKEVEERLVEQNTCRTEAKPG